MTEQEIRQRLKALSQYKFSLLSSMPDEGERTDRELMKIMSAESKLRAMLNGAGDQLGVGVSPQASATAPASSENHS